LAHLGHAILGDRTYGKFDNAIFANWPMPRVMLHAHRLHLVHPVTEKAMVFTAPIPKDFIVLEKWLAKTYGERRFVEEA
jgi:23S rRNA pseudouridine1911/1915/1917 synthase